MRIRFRLFSTPPVRRYIRRRRIRAIRHRQSKMSLRALLQTVRRRTIRKPLPLGLLAQQQRMVRALDNLDLTNWPDNYAEF